MTTNDIFVKYARRLVALKVGLLPAGDEPQFPYVVIEAAPRGLRMLSVLFLAMAEKKEPCKIHLAPFGAGSFHFSKAATHGMYVHRVPCKYEEIELEKVKGGRKVKKKVGKKGR